MQIVVGPSHRGVALGKRKFTLPFLEGVCAASGEELHLVVYDRPEINILDCLSQVPKNGVDFLDDFRVILVSAPQLIAVGLLLDALLGRTILKHRKEVLADALLPKLKLVVTEEHLLP